MKSIKEKVDEQRPGRGKPFVTGAAEHIKHILTNETQQQKQVFFLLLKTYIQMAGLLY